MEEDEGVAVLDGTARIPSRRHGAWCSLVLPRVPHALLYGPPELQKCQCGQRRDRVLGAGGGEAGRGERAGTDEEDGSVFPGAVEDEEPHGGAEEFGAEAVAHSCTHASRRVR